MLYNERRRKKQKERKIVYVRVFLLLLGFLFVQLNVFIFRGINDRIENMQEFNDEKFIMHENRCFCVYIAHWYVKIVI